MNLKSSLRFEVAGQVAMIFEHLRLSRSKIGLLMKKCAVQPSSVPPTCADTFKEINQETEKALKNVT